MVCPTVCRPPQRTWKPPGSLHGSTPPRLPWTPPQRRLARCPTACVPLAASRGSPGHPPSRTQHEPCHIMTQHRAHTLERRRRRSPGARTRARTAPRGSHCIPTLKQKLHALDFYRDFYRVRDCFGCRPPGARTRAWTARRASHSGSACWRRLARSSACAPPPSTPSSARCARPPCSSLLGRPLRRSASAMTLMQVLSQADRCVRRHPCTACLACTDCQLPFT